MGYCFDCFFILLIHAFSKDFLAGLIATLHLAVVALTSCFLISTTRELDIIYSVENVFKPLRRFGVNIEKLSFSLFLCMRSIAIIHDQYQQVHLAQKARGLQKHPLAIVMPLLLKMFRGANMMADALIARGFNNEAP